MDRNGNRENTAVTLPWKSTNAMRRAAQKELRCLQSLTRGDTDTDN